MTLTDREKVERIRQAYYDPKVGLVSGNRLYRKLRSEDMTRKDISNFMEKQQVNQMHHQSKKPDYYPIYSMMDGSFQMDLMFYPRLKKINNGYDTIMTCIEVTTRKGYCIPMKGKKTEVVLDAWQLLKDGTNDAGMEIRMLTTDMGSEWISDAFDEVLEALIFF